MTNNHRYNHFVIFALILIVGFGLALTVPLLANSQGISAQNDPEISSYPSSTTCYASPDNGSTVFSNTNANPVQQAVDAASPGSTVKVAGTCVGVQTRAGLTQTVYISKSLTLEGGHTQTDWSIEPDPETYPTILDANKNGRVAVVLGNINVTIEGFSITGGLAKDGTMFDQGGGIWTNTSLTLKNSQVFSNTADLGGGFYCKTSVTGSECNPNLNDVSFSGNSARVGGGLYNNGYNSPSNPKLTNVSFSENSAEYYGGAMYNNGSNYGESSPILTNVIFSGNSAGERGGAMHNSGSGGGDSSPKLINVTFSGNSSGEDGGAMYNGGYDGLSSPNLTNVTFSGNLAGDEGGAMYNYGENGISSPDVRNSILWNNRDSSGTGTISATIYNENATITLTHSLVENSGGSGGWLLDPTIYVNGGGNIDEDPLFLTPISPTTAPTTTGNLRLGSGSPAIDAGDDKYITVTFDLDEKPRKVDGDGDGTATVDMGAYEYQIPYIYDIELPLIIR